MECQRAVLETALFFDREVCQLGCDLSGSREKPLIHSKPDLLATYKPREKLLEDLVLLADPADESLEFPIHIQG